MTSINFVFKCFLKFPGHHAKKIKLAENDRQITSYITPRYDQEQEEVLDITDEQS